MDPQQTQQLLERAKEGDRQAFATLVEGHYNMMYRVAYRWCGNREDAEDVVQECCIKLGRFIRSFKGESLFTSWLYKIVLHTVRDFQRKHKKQPIHDEMALEGAEAPTGQNPEEQTALKELWREVHKLPDKQRDAVLLVYAEDLNHAEAAVVMECKESTVSWYLHEARKTLAKPLKK